MLNFKMNARKMGKAPSLVPTPVDFGVYRTREQLINALIPRHCISSHASSAHYSNVVLLPSKDGDLIRVYSLQKFRRKMKAIMPRPLTKDEKRKYCEYNRQNKRLEQMYREPVIAYTHWVATYYDIPVAILKHFKIKVVQGKNTFTIEQMKG